MKKAKKIAGWLHLWLGLVTGLIITIVSITGCMFVFAEELFSLFNPRLTEVSVGKTMQPLSLMKKNAEAALGKGKEISGVIYKKDPERSYVFTAFEANKKEDIGLTYFSQVKYWDEVYVNPYTGRVLGVYDAKYGFFNIVRQIHQHLLLVKPVGSFIVGGSVLIFLVIMITGFILWLPKSLKTLKKSLSIKWGAKWKRVNYDLHNSLGFYILPVAMLIVITGLVWSFKWWESGIYKIMGNDMGDKRRFIREQPLVSVGQQSVHPEDMAFHELTTQLHGNFLVVNLNFGEKKTAIQAFVEHAKAVDGWRNVSYYFMDNKTGRMIDKLLHQNKPLGLKWRNSNYDIHTGRIYGWPTQVLAFFASLICATLPVSGFLIWWGKRKKAHKKSIKKSITQFRSTRPYIPRKAVNL